MTTASKQVLTLIILTLLPLASSAQAQQGRVRTIGRYGKPGKPVSGVMVKANGPYNAVLSGADGAFSLTMDGIKNGEAYSLASVKKASFELVDKDLQGRKLGFSSVVPLEIVLVSQAQLAAEKAAVAEKFEAKFTEQYQAKVAELEAKVKSLEVSREEALKERESLDNQWMKLLDQIEEMTDRYARTDYDNLSELDQKIANEIENGNFDEAERLIKSKGSVEQRLQSLKEEGEKLAKNREAIEKAERLQAMAEDENAKAKENLAKDLRQLFEIAKANYQRDTAWYYVQKLVELDPENPEFLDECGHFARKHMAQFAKALEMYEKALDLKIKNRCNYGDICQSYLNLEYIYNNIARYEEAETQLVLFKDAFEGNEYSSPIFSDYLEAVGILDFKKARYDESIEMFEKSLSIRLKVYGPEHPDVASCYNNLGLAYSSKARYDEAIEMYEKSLSIRLKVYGLEHPGVASCYNNLGNAYRSKARYDEAIEMYEKALAIYLKVYGPEHPNVATCYGNLGLAYSIKARYDEAFEMYEKALSIRLKVYGPEHPDVATCYNNLGRAYSSKARYDEAIEMYEKALSIRLKVYGPEHPDVATCYLNMGTAAIDMGQCESALNYLSLALNTKEISSLTRARILATTGKAHFKLGNYDQAISILNQIVNDFESLGMKTDLATVHLWLGEAFKKKREYLEAKEEYNTSYEMRRSIFGDESEKTKEAYEALTVLLEEASSDANVQQ